MHGAGNWRQVASLIHPDGSEAAPSQRPVATMRAVSALRADAATVAYPAHHGALGGMH